MKRELKLSTSSLMRYLRASLQSLSRWKGNWNMPSQSTRSPQKPSIAEPIPMKRELKPFLHLELWPSRPAIAEPIPMKRELKRRLPWSAWRRITDCRAYPDEKGIETSRCMSWRWLSTSPNCRAYPDEKGIETWISWRDKHPAIIIAEPIPMKRELKLDSPATYRGPPYEYCRAYPDEKGIETIPGDDRTTRLILLQSLSRWKGNWNRFPK